MIEIVFGQIGEPDDEIDPEQKRDDGGAGG